MLLGAVTAYREAPSWGLSDLRCMWGVASVHKAPPWLLCPLHGLFSSPEGPVPGPGLLGEGTQGKGCGCKESPAGAMDVLRDISKLCYTMDFSGAGRLPTPPAVWAPLPSGFLGGGGHGGPTRSPPPPRSLGRRSPGAGGRAGVRQEETRCGSLHSWEQSATEVPRRALPVSDLSLSLRVSVPTLPPHTPTPPATFQPPRENKSAPSPDAPTSDFPRTCAPLPSQLVPSPQSDPKLSKCPLLASAQTARGQGPRQPPRGSGARLWGVPPTPLSAARVPPSAPRRVRPPGPSLPGRVTPPPAPSQPFGAAPLPAASPAPGPRRAGVRPPAPDPLGPNASAAALAPWPRGLQPVSGAAMGVWGGACGASVRSVQHFMLCRTLSPYPHHAWPSVSGEVGAAGILPTPFYREENQGSQR